MSANGSEEAIWTFDKQIVSLASNDGLHCLEGVTIMYTNVTGPFTVAVGYDDVIRPGDLWSVDASAVDITFADGSVLEDAIGETV